MIKNIKKINLIKNNHLLKNQNWNFLSKKMEIFHNKNGINCYEWLDKELKEKKILNNWTGFLHNVINYPAEYPQKYTNKIACLSDLVRDDYFLDKLNNCVGIFVFTNQIKIFLEHETKFKNIHVLKHPAPDFVWSHNCWKEGKNIIHVGQQLRKYHSFLELETKKNKIMINPMQCENDILEMQKYSSKKVKIIENLNLKSYLDLLCNSIVFLDLYDVAACNTIVECMVLGVPILVKKLSGSVEYLGEDYPFYFDDLKEANNKINDDKLIEKSNIYLKNINKNSLKINNFLNDFANIFLNN